MPRSLVDESGILLSSIEVISSQLENSVSSDFRA